MKRREFMLAVAAAAAPFSLRPRAGSAQQAPKVAVVGALVIGNTDPGRFWREFRRGMRDLAYIEGQNIRYEFRSAHGELNRLPELAAELVRLKVDVIVAWFTPAALAAKQATHDIPIRPDRDGADREPSAARGKRHRHRQRNR